ncbi:MAG: hypothetical protein ACI8ZM_002874 [Crocinitomix sp.]|jgi:hypothetical protein
MKSLCLLAIGIMIFSFSSPVYGQTMKDKLQAQKDKLVGQKKGKVYAPDLTDEEVMGLLGGAEVDDGIISPFHQGHLGQVVFTKKKMEPKDITEADIATEFSINDPIYFTFFMSKSLRNQPLYPIDMNVGGFNQGWCWDYSFKKFYPETNESGVPQYNGYGKHMVFVEIDGVQIEDIIFFVTIDFNSSKTAFTGYIAPNPSEVQPTTAWIELMAKLSEGDHKVNVEVAGFSLDAGMSKEQLGGQFTLKKKAGESYAPVMGKSWSNYSSKMNNAKLEAKVLKAVQDYGRVNSYSEKFIKIKIASSDWTITRTKTIVPVITGRYIIAYCYSTWPNGQCKVQRYSFRQEYDGSGYQSTVISRGVYNNDYPQAIDCD